MRGLAWLLLLWGGSPALADEVDDWLRDLRTHPGEASGAERARLAWEKLARQGPESLPRVLAALDTSDTVAANWIGSALDRIVANARARKQPIDPASLLSFAADRSRQGRARRTALELAEEIRPGSFARLLNDALEDPEFGHDAIERALKTLHDQPPAADQARARLRQLLAASRDLEQGRQIAAALKDRKEEVSLAVHLGFLRHWHVIGPFDGQKMKGFRQSYPPEEKVDLKKILTGKAGKPLTWKPFEAPETWTGRHQALVDLRQALGAAEDAVAFAFTQVRVKDGGSAELRGAADDNFTLWVNGERVFGFEEYRNGVRLDRHRVKITLRPGLNTILVKVCQAPSDETHREPNWEFLLRLCDGTGRGIPFEQGQ